MAVTLPQLPNESNAESITMSDAHLLAVVAMLAAANVSKDYVEHLISEYKEANESVKDVARLIANSQADLDAQPEAIRHAVTVARDWAQRTKAPATRFAQR